VRQPASVPAANNAVPTMARSATALFDFDGDQPGDLSFKKGEVIDLISFDDTWWEGFIGDRIGCFPRNYVQLNIPRPVPRPKATVAPVARPRPTVQLSTTASRHGL